MVCRRKKSESRIYLQLVENRWEDARSKQRVMATLGRLDQLQQSGQLEGLLRSGAKFCQSVALLAAHRRSEMNTWSETSPFGRDQARDARRIHPPTDGRLHFGTIGTLSRRALGRGVLSFRCLPLLFHRHVKHLAPLGDSLDLAAAGFHDPRRDVFSWSPAPAARRDSTARNAAHPSGGD